MPLITSFGAGSTQGFGQRSETTLWSPGDFAETFGWWDASDTSTFTVNGSNNVTAWNNKQNSSQWQMVSDGGAATPVSGATTVNGLNVFDFTNPQRLAAARQQAPWTKDGDLTVISFNVIGTVNQSGDSIVSNKDKNNASWQVEANDAAAFNGNLGQTNLLSGGYALTGGPYTGNTIMAQDLDYGTNTMRTRMNGTQVGSSSNYTNQQGNSMDFRVMSNAGGNRQLAGSFGELIVAHFANGYTDSQDYIEKVEGYLAYKWGVQSLLPSDHPYKVHPPRQYAPLYETLSPIYQLERSKSNVNEGGSFTITLRTTNVSDGTNVPYTITGVSSADIDGASLTGNFTVDSYSASIGLAEVSFNVTADNTTEGAETFTLALDNGEASIDVVINDTSVGT